MKYNWDLKQIIKYKMEAISALLNTKDLNEIDKDLIKKNIDIITDLELCYIFKKNVFNSFEISKCIDKNKVLANNTYQQYKKIPKVVKTSILDATSKLTGLVDLYDQIDFSKTFFSDDDLISLSYDFFKWLPTNNKKYEKLFSEYTNPNNHLLKFTRRNSESSGSTFYFHYPFYKPFFSITRVNTIEDFITLNHELAHGIFFQQNSSKFTDYLAELEGHFFEFLSIEFLKDKLNRKELDELEYSRFNCQYINMADFYITDLAINLFEAGKNISVSPIKQNILENKLPTYINKDIMTDALKESPISDSIYLFSYLTSLDLENIYDFDPEYAFYLFEGVRNNKTDDIMTNLRDHAITFMDDDYESLQKTIKKINRLGIK